MISLPRWVRYCLSAGWPLPLHCLVLLFSAAVIKKDDKLINYFTRHKRTMCICHISKIQDTWQFTWFFILPKLLRNPLQSLFCHSGTQIIIYGFPDQLHFIPRMGISAFKRKHLIQISLPGYNTQTFRIYQSKGQ